MPGPEVVEQEPPRRGPPAAVGVAAVAGVLLAVVVARGGGDDDGPRPSPAPVATSPAPSPGTAFFTIPGSHATQDDGNRLTLRIDLLPVWPGAFDVVGVTPVDRFGEPAARAHATLVPSPGDREANDPRFTPVPEPMTVALGARVTLLLRVTGCSPVTAVRLDVVAGGHRRDQLVALGAAAPEAAATLLARCQPSGGPPL